MFWMQGTYSRENKHAVFPGSWHAAQWSHYDIVWMCILLAYSRLCIFCRHSGLCVLFVSLWTILYKLLERIACVTFVDVVCCYRPSSVVCQFVCWSVTLVSPAKTVELIEMPFGLRTRVGPRNHVLDGSSDPPMGRGNFEWERGVPL